MYTFVHIPSANNEDIETFNDRVSQFCSDNDVVDIDVDTVHDGIKLCLVEVDDLPVPMPLLVSPVVVPFGPAERLNLERFIEEIAERFRVQHSEADPQLPIRTKVLMRQDDPQSGYVVIVISLGLLPEDEEPAQEPAQEGTK